MSLRHAEIVAIGSELTSGEKLDTNSQWLSLALAEIGIPVRYHTSMADELEAMVEVLRAAALRSDLVLVTGGLGPTLDDLTRDALAALAGVDLVLDEESLAVIRDMFARRKRVMPERNVVQAMFPRGSRAIPNPRGTAPGIRMEWSRGDGSAPVLLVAMPGVPSEMKRMFLEEVRPQLPSGAQLIRRTRIHCFGLGESQVEERLGDVTARGREPEVGITAHEATITLRIRATGPTESECAAQTDAVRRTIRERLGDVVFGEEDEELEHVVLRMLGATGGTLATVEQGSGGALAQRLTDVAGGGTAYLGGIVAPTDRALRTLLDVPAGSASDKSQAEALAERVRSRFDADFGLAVTDWPLVDPDDPQATPPACFVALATRERAESLEHVLVGDPAIARSRAAKTALDLLRRRLPKPVPAP